MKNAIVFAALGLLVGVGSTAGAAQDDVLILTSSNAQANQLLVYDNSGTLIRSVSTEGQGGAARNGGGIAVKTNTVAVVNFGSQSVAIFDREGDTLALRQLVPTLSPPLSVAFGKDHLYVLGTATVESHRIQSSAIDSGADGQAALLRADGSAAQVGVLGEQLVISEKNGPVEIVGLVGGAVAGTPVEVALPASSLTPFGLVTRGGNAYVTFATSDEVSLIKNGRVAATTAIGSGTPDGPGQHAPCWIAVVGAYAFTTNSPSHSISRFIVTGDQVIIEDPTAAHTNGAPTDIAASAERIAVVESDGNVQAHLTQFLVSNDGSLTQVASSAIASPANGVAIVQR
jgi:hypothetical protein